MNRPLVVPLALLLVALLTVPLAAGVLDPAPAGAPALDTAKDCDAPTLEEAAAVPWDAAAETASVIDPATGVDQALLERLYADLVHLDGFIDVHFVLEGPPRFIAWFDGPPQPLPVVDAPYPIDAQTLAAVPLADIPVPQEAAMPDAVAGDLLPAAEDSAPLIPQNCSGLRPGKGLGGGCTVAWVLRGSNGKTYMASAGHCASTGADVGYGKVVYSRNEGVGWDFLVAEIYPEYLSQVSPSMCHWGGPTGETANAGFGRQVVQYGNGIVFGTHYLTKPRPALLYSYGSLSYSMLGPQINGDSGSPVRLESGTTLGVHTHGVGVIVVGTGMGFGTRLSHGIGLAENALGLDLQLVTAPVA